MKKLVYSLYFLSLFLLLPFPAFAQATEVAQVQNFIQNIIQILVTLSGLIAAGFIVWGGLGYITSSGNPENLERSKRTILYSAVGLAIVLGAFVISSAVTQLATNAFAAK